jgi:hypothetical protein
VDGDLADEGWRGATRVEKFYEINPGDNVEPPVKSVGYLTYDTRFFTRLRSRGSESAAIRAPLGDHDKRPRRQPRFCGHLHRSAQ